MQHRHMSKTLFLDLLYYTASQTMAFSVSALPGWSMSGVRWGVGSVSGAPVHEGHAQKTGWRLTVLLIVVHFILPQATYKQPWATRLIHHLIWVKSGECLERELKLLQTLLCYVGFFGPKYTHGNLRPNLLSLRKYRRLSGQLRVRSDKRN